MFLCGRVPSIADRMVFVVIQKDAVRNDENHTNWIWLFFPQTTDANLGQAHCLLLRALSLDLFSLEITKSKKFLFQTNKLIHN